MDLSVFQDFLHNGSCLEQEKDDIKFESLDTSRILYSYPRIPLRRPIDDQFN